MDVNDLGGSSLPTDLLKEVTQSTRTSASTSASQQTSPQTDISIQLSESGNQTSASDLRNRANQIINVVNITATATNEIGNLLESVSGIVEQAKSADLGETKRGILQKEANQLIEEIKSKAHSAESNGIRPLIGDNIRFEVEEKYGETLELILPDNAKDGFGLGQINLSLKDSIIDTIARVEQAKRQMADLRESVDHANVAVRKTVDTLEVALQNNEASKATIRSVDHALLLATSTHAQIGANPEQALESFGKLDLSSAVLLRT